jgi:hypothetical protein
MSRYYIQLTIFCIILSACKSALPTTSNTQQLSVDIIKEDFMDCFAEGLSASGKPVWCEASASLFDGNQLYFANDKSMPNQQSSVFFWKNLPAFYNRETTNYKTEDFFKKGTKYEDFAISPNRKWVFLTTAFDRVKEDSKEWDSYNMLLYWRQDTPDAPQVLSINNQELTSVKLRAMISSALALNNLDYLGAVRYFKIEGMAATADKLFFGIREEGNTFEDFKHVVKIISIPYQIILDPNGIQKQIALNGNFEIVADINPQKNTTLQLPKNVGLSSIEYDPFRKLFWILTSSETGTTFSGYLWTATIEQLQQNKLQMVTNSSKNPIVFSHKPEDLTFLPNNKILIVHDDDRARTTIRNEIRKPNQAAYTILQIR